MLRAFLKEMPSIRLRMILIQSNGMNGKTQTDKVAFKDVLVRSMK